MDTTHGKQIFEKLLQSVLQMNHKEHHLVYDTIGLLFEIDTRKRSFILSLAIKMGYARERKTQIVSKNIQITEAINYSLFCFCHGWKNRVVCHFQPAQVINWALLHLMTQRFFTLFRWEFSIIEKERGWNWSLKLANFQHIEQLCNDASCTE